jgi:hypothetical protein
MTTSTRPLTYCTLGLFVTLGLSLSVAQASQDGRGRGRGRGISDAAPSQEDQFFEICDHDSNKWISFREANYSLRIDRTKFGSIDVNSDARISASEFSSYYEKTRELSGAFRTPLILPGSTNKSASNNAVTRTDSVESEPIAKASSLKELFGSRENREDRPNTVPLPPRIEGPVSAFARLDLNADGKITIEDLDGLARPVHLDVRFPAVIAILDTDHDGGISPKELYASMR